MLFRLAFSHLQAFGTGTALSPAPRGHDRYYVKILGVLRRNKKFKNPDFRDMDPDLRASRCDQGSTRSP